MTRIAQNPRADDRPIRPIAGWALRRLHSLEDATGLRLIGPLATAETSRRAVVFAVLASRLGSSDPGTLAPRLLSGRLRDLLEDAYGPFPGLLPILRRIGPDPLPVSWLYRRLLSLVRAEDRRGQKELRVLCTVPRITIETFRIIDALPDELLYPEVVAGLSKFTQAQQLADVARFLRRYCPLPDRALARLLAPVANEPPKAMLARTLVAFGRDITPLAHDDDFEVLRDGRRFAELGDKMGLCLRDRILDAALGLTAYLRYRHEPCVAELRRIVTETRGEPPRHDWMIDGLYMTDNLPPTKTLAREILARLTRRGFVRLAMTHSPDLPTWLSEHHGDTTVWLSFLGCEGGRLGGGDDTDPDDLPETPPELMRLAQEFEEMRSSLV
ncbi:hypothetical protein LAZ40_00755 [Cereibacter sphaeroides]|uniref:hypothetical protein n=1 Tax=Cereibacter sphaeroides TaxID=1063 RepID=UPI001F35D2FA|nr:hypothetical protein [Cereibacter sphaeroides]MCE6957601.1 hypothetical protein [Cereibacter sphaeroides]MCE6971304.1 hypothetical protein [Cereibacter sphaeroides]